MEWIIKADISMVGVTAIVEADTEEEARAKFRALDIPEGIDTSTGELVDWKLTEVEPNE